jgi:hypothetical protein
MVIRHIMCWGKGEKKEQVVRVITRKSSRREKGGGEDVQENVDKS